MVTRVASGATASRNFGSCHSRLEVDPMALKDVRVWGTVLGGRVFPAQRG